MLDFTLSLAGLCALLLAERDSFSRLDWTLLLAGLDLTGLYLWLDWTLSRTGLDPGLSLCCRLHSPLTGLDCYSAVDCSSKLDIPSAVCLSGKYSLLSVIFKDSASIGLQLITK